MYDPWTDAGLVDLGAYLSRDERARLERMLDEDRKRAAEALTEAGAGRIRQAYERWGVIFNSAFPAY